MPNEDTPLSSPDHSRTVPVVPPAPDVEAVCAVPGFREAVARAGHILVLPPELDPARLKKDMAAFLDHYPHAEDARQVESKALIRSWSGIGRASNRWRDVSRRLSGLSSNAMDMMGLVKEGVEKSARQRYIAHIEELERGLAEMVNGVSTQGLAYVMNPEMRTYSEEFAGRLEKILRLMEEGCGGIERPAGSLLDDYERIAHFLADYLIFRKTGDHDDWDVRFQRVLAPHGLDDERVVRQFQRIRDELPTALNRADLEEAVSLRVEHLMRLAINGRLERLVVSQPAERSRSVERVCQELLAFIHMTINNRRQLAGGLYLPLIARERQSQKRPIGQYPFLKGVQELLRAFHQCLRLISSEAYQKKYLLGKG